MTGSNRNARFSIMALSALAAFSIGVWFTLAGSLDGPASAKRGATGNPLAGGPASTRDAAGSQIPIFENGRLTLDEDALPAEGALTLVLDMPDEARGTGEHMIRIVSVDGRRIETTGIPRSGAGTGVELEVDTTFLSRGRYMIEIETEDDHPLQIRRYVLDLK
jgi:hypothetical protein